MQLTINPSDVPPLYKVSCLSNIPAELLYSNGLLSCLFLGKGKMVDGRAMMVQFAKYGPNAERM